MPALNPTRTALLIALIFLSLCALYSYGLPVLIGREADAALNRYGIQGARYQNLTLRGDNLTLSGVKLDSDGFSTADSVRARIRWAALFGDSSLFSTLEINGLSLTGEVGENGRFSLYGWQPSALPRFADLSSLTIENARIDLTTAAGGVRLEGELHLVPQEDGSRKLQATVTSEQHQLSFDTRWDGKIGADGTWTLSADIREARLSLDKLAATRTSGWISFEGSGKEVPSLSGQIAAGLVRFGGTPMELNNINATIDGRIDAIHVILSAAPAREGETAFNADITTGRDPALNFALESKDADKLLAFAQSLSRNVQDVSSGAAGFTALLLTPGNIKRLKGELPARSYDTLRFVADGTPSDLTGKIIATRYGADGVPQNNVISINPGR